MDGTLTRAAHDFDAIRTTLGITSGVPILEAIKQLPPKQAQQKTIQLHQLEMDIAAKSVAQPDADELLSAIKRSGGKTGILTRNAEDIAEVTLQAAGLSQFFSGECIIGRELCQPKPHPQGIEHLMSAWQANPQETAMVGDYLFDLQAGRNAQVTTVHFDHTGTFSWPQLADVKIQALSQLLPL